MKGQRRILVASTNQGKLRELREMLGGDIQWVGLRDFPSVAEIEEDGQTFAENARKKALEYAKATGFWTLADDSGLVIDAIGGQPGVRSARFAGPLPPRHKDTKGNRKEFDRRNFEKVLALLGDVQAEKRTARFVCCLCLASPQEILAETEGTVEGIITEKPIGENGFGYDPIFLIPKLSKTVAQLSAEEKNAISHRGNAIRKMKPLLVQLLHGG